VPYSSGEVDGHQRYGTRAFEPAAPVPANGRNLPEGPLRGAQSCNRIFVRLSDELFRSLTLDACTGNRYFPARAI
jgi:hypothetical protein